ncbi:MAG: hypothetical protein IKJ77_05825 [Firmicutes bacterium]|nr:hypothetical protein [Bacillota bacterium]
MEYLGVFGFIAFVLVLTLQGKVSKLERQMREAGIAEEGTALNGNLSASLEKRIGRQVKLDFYDSEADADIVGLKSVTILDVDEKWVLVHCENKKKSFDKLVRISTIKGIAEV